MFVPTATVLQTPPGGGKKIERGEKKLGKGEGDRGGKSSEQRGKKAVMELTMGTTMPNNEGKEADWQKEQRMEGPVAGRQIGGEVGKRRSWAARR